MTNPVAVSAGVIAVTVAVAAAIIIMESPEVRRQAENLRRRVAAAMRGRRAPSDADYDEFREPMYNRPEDADGFMMSSQHHTYDRDADEINLDDDDVTEEARRRQREELNYWNAIHESKKMDDDRKAAAAAAAALEKDAPEPPRRGSATSFDDFLKPDENAENGTFVYNSSADVHNNNNSGLRRRGEPQPESRGLESSFYTATSSVSVAGLAADSAAGVTVSAFDDMSDIYSATTAADVPLMPIAPIPEQPLIQYDSDDIETASSSTLERAATPVSESPMNPFHDINATQSPDEAFASIQAWAEHSNESVFSSTAPASVSDAAMVESAVLPHAMQQQQQQQQQQQPSEPSVISFDEDDEDEDGVMTPTDSLSPVGSDVDLAHDHETTSNAGSRFDVISQTDGMLTPASWSDVGSIVSDDDMHVPA